MPAKEKWTLEEENLLRSNFNVISLKDLSGLLKKDKKTVRRKALILGLCENNSFDRYTTEELAMGLGVHEAQIILWVRKGWLKSARVNRDLLFIDKDIRDFIFAHPDQLNPRKFDWLWVVDILSGEYGIGRLDADRFDKKEKE